MWQTILNRRLSRLIRHGTLIVEDAAGRVARFGTVAPEVRVRLADPALARRLVAAPELALGEAYMDGTLLIENDDVFGMLTLLMRNLPHPSQTAATLGSRAARALAPLARRLHQTNPLARSRSNVAHHYDLPDELYRLFLDRDLQYSCAYFRAPEDDLDTAQASKKRHIAKKLLLRPGQHVLDIGCGWGGLALTLARDHGVRVTGVTLSTRQHEVASQRALRAGLADRVDFRLMDYRELTGKYDRIVSVGMFEHVGTPQYDTFFAHLADRLAEDGVALVHTIGRTTPPGGTGAFIRKYIFPGGYAPALSEAMAAVERQPLIATDIEIWRLHYAETLRHWRTRFESAVGDLPAPLDQRFVRMWRYYLCASEVGFRMGQQVVFQIQLARQQEAVPLTRDYLSDDAPADQPRQWARQGTG